MSNLNSLFMRKEMLETEISALQASLSQMPAGTLITRRKGSDKYEYRYYLRDSEDGTKKEIYIPQKNRELASQLAWKMYMEKQLADYKKELQALAGYLSYYNSEKDADIFLKKHPGAGKLILQMLSSTEYAKNWKEQPYTRSNYHPEGLIYTTVDPDLKVRSKAESDIISRLVYFAVPFRYEEQLIINGTIIHPDLTCLNVRTREEFYWEHQGAWDRHEYVMKLPGREDQYRMAGIFPWKNLIITTETANRPLDINWVDTIIQYYLL